MTLAEATTNTISNHISEALQDTRVSDEEFSLTLSELGKLSQMKDEIRTQNKSKIDYETRQSLIK